MLAGLARALGWESACSKTRKHRSSEHFIHEAQTVWTRARPYPNVCRSFSGRLLYQYPGFPPAVVGLHPDYARGFVAATLS